MISSHDLQILSSTSLVRRFPRTRCVRSVRRCGPRWRSSARARPLADGRTGDAGGDRPLRPGRGVALYRRRAGRSGRGAWHGRRIWRRAHVRADGRQPGRAAHRRRQPRLFSSRLRRCLRSARRAAARTVRGCWKICSARFRKNIGDCSGASSVCPFRMGGGGWRFISARRAQRISCSPFPGNRWPGSSA